MKHFVLVSIVVVVGFFSKISAAETKIGGRLYADWNLETSAGAESANSYNLSRAYVTVRSKLSDYTSLRITTDLRETSGFEGYSIIVKYGYIDWKPKFGAKKLRMRFGLQPTLYIDHMNKIWGRRYLEKTVGDKNKFLTTSDLGFSTALKMGEKGKYGYAAIQILNGTAYTAIEELNKNKDISGFVLLNPFTNSEVLKHSKIIGQAYIGTQNKVIDTTDVGTEADASAYKKQLFSLGGILAYNNTLDLGADVNFMTLGGGYLSDGTQGADVTSSGISFFGTFYLADLAPGGSVIETLNLFGRFDMIDPDTDTSNDAKSVLFAGIETTPTKGFKASLNLRTITYESDSKASQSYLFVNALFKF